MVIASLRVNSQKPIERVKTEIERMEKIKYGYIVTGEYPLFIMAKCLDHEDSMNLIEKLRNLPEWKKLKPKSSLIESRKIRQLLFLNKNRWFIILTHL